MTTIFISVQTGMVARDLLRCGPLERVLSHPEARVVLLTPGVRDQAFVDEFANERVAVVPLESYAPNPLVWRLMVRRWRHARSPAVADLVHSLERRLSRRQPRTQSCLRTMRRAWWFPAIRCDLATRI